MTAAGEFDSQRLTSDASLNNVVLASACAPETQGRLAEDVCSRNALHILATDLGLANLRPERLADDLASILASTNADAAQAAATALHIYGLRLGALIATLRDPLTSDQQADTPARRAFLAHWLTVDGIWLAGGLLTTACSGPILDGVRAAAGRATKPCRIALTPYPELAALLGAARRAYADCPDRTIAVADLGHTHIKTAIVRRSGKTLPRFRLLDRYPAPAARSAPDVVDAVTSAFSSLVRKAADSNARSARIAVSIASFVADGMPVDGGQSTYGCLTNHKTAMLRRLKADTGVSVDIDFVHDGTAAASAVTSANSATITVGTWLGVGFQPAAGPPLLEIPLHTSRVAILSPDGLSSVANRGSR